MSKLYPLAIEALVELAPEINAAESRAINLLPNLDTVLEEMGNIPTGALFIGMAEDGLPVLLNLYDSIPGPIVVLGDEGAGKTSLLKNLAAATNRLFDPHDLQFGVLTSSPAEWEGLAQTRHCAGVIPIYENSAMDFVLSLNAWAHANKSRQTVIMLLDGLDKVTNWNENAIDDLRWLLMRGPSKRVWPVVSLNSHMMSKTNYLLSYFRTYIYGSIQDKNLNRRISQSDSDELSTLTSGSQFAMQEGNEWLKFWIPRIE